MGYGMLGFSQGLQSGAGLGMQLRQMQWQNEEKKKIEKKAEETKTALSDFFGSSYGQTMMTGGNLSDNDKTMFMTALQGATAEARGVMGSVYSAWQQGDRETYTREMDRLNILLEFYGGNNKFDISNMEAAFEGLVGTFQTQDAINAATAGRNIIASRQQPMDTERLDIAVKGTGAGSPASLAETNKLLGTNYKPENLTPEQGTIVHNAAVILNNAAALGKSSFTSVLNQMQLDQKYKDAGVILDGMTFEKWTAKTTTQEPANIKDVAYSINQIKNADSPEEAQTFANAHIKEFGDLSDLGIEGSDVKKYWGENKRYILESMAQDLDTLTNEEGFIRPNEETTRNFFGAKQTMTNKEWIKAIASEYKPLWDELKALGVDLTGIFEIDLNNMKTISASWFNRSTGKGDIRPGSWWIRE